MTKPVRLQLSRAKGFNLQALSLATNGLPAVNVARPSRWGNPYNWKEGVEIGNEGWAKGAAVELYLEWLRSGRGPSAPTDDEIRGLRGKNLACWCKPGESCHADVLLARANSEARAA